MYATVEDMIDQWGEAEMARLTAPEGQLDDIVIHARAERALADASSTIDGYLRKRYTVPLVAPVPLEVARICRVMARHDLAHGEQREPTQQMADANKAAMAWLRDVADGRVELDLARPSTTSAAGARVLDRDVAFAPGAGLAG